jgi:hypothetical protein
MLYKMKRKSAKNKSNDTIVISALNESVETVTLSSSSEDESVDKSDVEELTDKVDQILTNKDILSDENVVLIDDKVILILTDKKSIYFKGKLIVQVLSGQLEVLGSTLTSNTDRKEVFSPRGYSLLCLSVKSSDNDVSNKFDSKNFDERLTQIGVKAAELRTRLTDCAKKCSTLVLLSKVEGDSNDFVSKFLSHSAGGKVGLFGRDSGFRLSTVPSNLFEAEKKLDVNFFVHSNDQVFIIIMLILCYFYYLNTFK